MQSATPHKLTLIVPVYNEAPHLKEFLKLLDSVDFSVQKEFIFIDDFSTDGSSEILKTFALTSPHKMICHDKNYGKGAAIRTGLANATGSIIGIHDADFEYDPNEIARVIAPLVDDSADFVFGSRFMNGRCAGESLFHFAVNRTLTVLSNFFSGLNLTDMETCYKFSRAEIFTNLKLSANRFGIEPEITAKIAKLNLRVTESPVSYRPRDKANGKKINWLDGLAAFWHIIRFSMSADFKKESMPEKYLRD